MPRVTKVKSARKDYPPNIKKGDTYYWWKFRRMPKQRSLTRPKPWQLTTSPFLQWLYRFEHDLELDTSSLDGLKGSVQDMIEEIETARDEVQESYENMPEQLRDTSDSGMLLEERLDALNEWLDNLQEIVDIDEPDHSIELTRAEVEDVLTVEDKRLQWLEELAEQAQESPDV